MTDTTSIRTWTIGVACGVVLAIVTAAAQQAQQPPAGGAAPAAQTPQSGPAAPGGGGGGRGRGGLPLMPYDDYTGFTKIWDGQTLTNWDGEADVWTIENGMLHADTTKTPGQHHIHYTGPNAVMKDFDLKVEFKISAQGANGGIQYRSRMLHTMHGGTLSDPMGKPTPANIKTVADAVAAGLTTNAGGGGGNRGGGAGGQGRGAGGPGAAAGPAGGAAGAPGGARGAGAPAGGGAPAAGGGARGGGATAAANAGAAATPAPTGPCTAGGVASQNGPNTPITTGNPWQVSGYQLDLDSNNQYTGGLYEGQGRGIIVAQGTIAELLPNRQRACIGVITDNPSQWVKPHRGLDGDWQQVEIIARGNTLIHILNGHVMTVAVDDDPEFRATQGILSLQLEGNGQIWYRNVYLKHLN